MIVSFCLGGAGGGAGLDVVPRPWEVGFPDLGKVGFPDLGGWLPRLGDLASQAWGSDLEKLLPRPWEVQKQVVLKHTCETVEFASQTWGFGFPDIEMRC